MRLLIIILSLIITLTPFAYAEGWDDFGDLDRAWDGQKSITNKQFEEAMDLLQEKKKKKEAKQRKKKIKKVSGGGTSLHSEMNPDNTITELQSIKPKNEGILVNLPVHLIIDGKTLDKGYYNVLADKDKDGNISVSFYQSQYLQGKVNATETEDDFEEKELDFAKVQIYNDSFIKLIFGCMDFNAYTYIPYKE